MNKPKSTLNLTSLQLHKDLNSPARGRLPHITQKQRLQRGLTPMRSQTSMSHRGLRTPTSVSEKMRQGPQAGITASDLRVVSRSGSERYPKGVPATSPAVGTGKLTPMRSDTRATTALPQPYHHRDETPIFPADADPERFNVEFTGSASAGKMGVSSL